MYLNLERISVPKKLWIYFKKDSVQKTIVENETRFRIAEAFCKFAIKGKLMEKGIFVFFNIMISAFIYGQDYVLSEYTFISAPQALNPSKSIVVIVGDRKIEGKFLENTTELERFCIYTHYYFEASPMRKYIDTYQLINDARKIFIDQVGLTEEEFEWFEKSLLAYKAVFRPFAEHIECKINKYLFKNINEIFVDEQSKPIEQLFGIKREIDVSGYGRYLLEFSDEGLLSKVTGDLDTKNYEVRYFNECGIIDSIESYSRKDKLTKTEYEKTNSRNWKGDNDYYADGSLFSEHRYGGEYSFRTTYYLSPAGDTLNLYQYDLTGDFEDFTMRSYTKNLNGEITSVDGVGIVNRYSYFQSDDSLRVSSKREDPTSIFLKLKDVLDINFEEVTQADSIFSHQFVKNISLLKETCVANYKTGVTSIFDDRESDFLPFINVSCDMLSDQIVERSKPKKYYFTNEDLAINFKSLRGRVKNKKSVELRYEYFNLQSDFTKGEWLYYSGLVKFMNNKVNDNDLLICYEYAMNLVVSMALSANYKRNEQFKVELNGLTEIVDTLGNAFASIKMPIVEEFRSTLDKDEEETLILVSQLYNESVTDYYDQFVKENYSVSYGIEKNKIEYFRLITQWQLRHFNQRLFSRRIYKAKVPAQFDAILQKFDHFLGHDKYDLLSKHEKGMFKSLDIISPNGVGGYGWTKFNPYLQVNDKRKREYRSFNWLLN